MGARESERRGALVIFATEDECGAVSAPHHVR
jgi:hypothetical protein